MSYYTTTAIAELATALGLEELPAEAVAIIETLVEEERDDAYSDGHDDGYSEGEDSGYQDGYENGYSEGQSEGYDEGYAEAREEFEDADAA
ncbi:hypothetical protein SEA_PROVOLONE_66 [Streptomyces phage Provolone]|nr:hypothetical protein SEA_PROVOLONE_66 [Streptomyces phage Provolone]